MDEIEVRVLQQYARFLVHMRAEKQDRRFGLVLGAGVSLPLKFPSWGDLVTRIADHVDVAGRHIIEGVGDKLPDTSKTQMLFQHYRSKNLENTKEVQSAKLERKIQGQWRRIIHDCLYRNAPRTASEIMDEHPYLRYFIDIIAQSSMTVNYNFDDTIQQLLLFVKERSGPFINRGFETVWNGSLSFRRDTSIIYHPNGFLPRNLLEYPSDNLVFSDDSFADQLIESMAGHHASLLHHFSKTTCLFIGLSLQDATLRHLLRQSALINPGHYHYCIQYVRPGAMRDEAAEKALFDANFEVYNLITLFLSDDEIAALGRLLVVDEDDLRHTAEEIGIELKLCFYLTGAVGAGKTTCLSYFGSFKTYDEWVEPRNDLLAKSWTDLSDSEKIILDDWIVRQFNLKNCRLVDQRVGIFVIDRSPLDPLAFTDEAEIVSKAKSIARGLSPGVSGRSLQGGHVILLTGLADDMEARVVGRHKQSKSDVIDKMQYILNNIFKKSNATIIDTSGLTIHQVLKRVARSILIDEYRPTDMSNLLSSIAHGAYCGGSA